MAHTVYAETLLTADLSNTRVFQPVSLENNTNLLGVRTHVVIYNSPVLTGLRLKIYSNRNGSPGGVIYTSDNSWTTAEITSAANASREIWFSFNDPLGVPLRGGDTYHLVLAADSYTGSDSSHIGWVKGWPDPVYKTGVTTTYNSLAVAPFQVSLLGGEL